MLSISIVCVGRLKESYLKSASAEYQKRLGAFCRLNIKEVESVSLPENPSPAQVTAALEKEGERIWAAVPAGAKTVALCIEGKMLTSEKLGNFISTQMSQGFSRLVFIIGSSHGLADSVKNRADFSLSLSKMTFPHQLARIMLLEQLYRAFMIENSGKYHK